MKSLRTWRMAKSVAVVAACWAFVTYAEDVAGYLRDREQAAGSRPSRRATPDDAPPQE